MATECMPPLTIQKSITIFGGHLKLPVHLDEGLTEEAGIVFIKLGKGQDKVHRLAVAMAALQVDASIPVRPQTIAKKKSR